MKRIILVLALLAVVAMPGIVARAETPSDAVITMQDVQSFRNLGASGDMLIIAHWRWSTGNATSTPASSAVTIRLVSENGTVLAATTPYVFAAFDDNGYGDGVASFYLTDNTTWGDSSEIQIVGLPAFFESPPYYSYTMGTADYTSDLTQADNRESMTEYILNLTDIFGTIYPPVELKIGEVLSSYGEAYFDSVIDNLQALCPALFYVQTFIPEEIDVQTYDMTTGDAYTARLVGTDIMLGAERIGAYIGVTGYVMFGIFTFAVCIVIIVLAMRATWPLEAPLAIDVGVVTAVAILVGDLVFTLIMIIGLVAVIGVSWAVLGKRA